ncbi:acetyltransferase [Shinella curvata]|uniref:Acetyltransferase n=1 Tax=Shinella curvata TaxID=1817964 RepID=A0ABT8XHS0_9HYPH|nr:acetyltransferase [Shinella curvata]MCJ8056118.1 acetyltransferase [Shinella curvata]MDO6123281.1 acetyltransferase [Shinella curvata]
MHNIRLSTSKDMAAAVEIWRRAVDATHAFLTPEDRAAIDAEVSAFFPQTTLHLAVDQNDTPLALMYLDNGHMEALFVDPACHGKGIGKSLIQAALVAAPNLTTDVNEQNLGALAFYEAIGFERTGRSECDGQGRPYPLIHLRYRSANG